LDGELGVPFVRHDFRVNNPDQSVTHVFEIPALGLGAKAGIAARFP
jgi:hypothetical protein